MKISAEKLRKLMAKKIVTIAELARLSGVSQVSLGMILNHNRKPNTATIGKLAKALKVDVSELLAEE